MGALSPVVAAALADRERDYERGRYQRRRLSTPEPLQSIDVPDEDRSLAGLRDELENGDPDIGREFALLRMIRKRGA